MFAEKGKENERSFSHGSWTKTKAVRGFPRCSSCRTSLQDAVFFSHSWNDRVQPVVVLSPLLPSSSSSSMRTVVKMTMSNRYWSRGKIFDLYTHSASQPERRTHSISQFSCTIRAIFPQNFTPFRSCHRNYNPRHFFFLTNKRARSLRLLLCDVIKLVFPPL